MSESTQQANKGEKVESIGQGEDPIKTMQKWFEETADDKPWETVKAGETKVFIFMLGKTQKIKKEFQGQEKTQYRFTVINQDNVEKTIDFSPRWAGMIFDLLKEGWQKLKITRKGEGTATEYTIVPLPA